jgi:hypothetical protein
VGKKYYFDGVAGESGRVCLAKRGNEGQLLESLFGTGAESSALFQSDRLNINLWKRKSVVLKVGLRTPNIGLRRGRFWGLRKAVPSSFSAILVSLRLAFCFRWGYGGGQCRVHRILGPLANNLVSGLAELAGLRDTGVMLSLRLSFTRLETRAQEFLTKCE